MQQEFSLFDLSFFFLIEWSWMIQLLSLVLKLWCLSYTCCILVDLSPLSCIRLTEFSISRFIILGIPLISISRLQYSHPELSSLFPEPFAGVPVPFNPFVPVLCELWCLFPLYVPWLCWNDFDCILSSVSWISFKLHSLGSTGIGELLVEDFSQSLHM